MAAVGCYTLRGRYVCAFCVKRGDLCGSEGVVAQGADSHSEAIVNKATILVRVKALQSMRVMGFNALQFFLWVFYGARVISIFLPFVYAWGIPITVFNANIEGWVLIFFILIVCIPDPLYYIVPEFFSVRRLFEVLFETLIALGMFVYFFIDMLRVADSFIGRTYSVFASQEAVFPGPAFWLLLSAVLLSSMVKILNFRFIS